MRSDLKELSLSKALQHDRFRFIALEEPRYLAKAALVLFVATCAVDPETVHAQRVLKHRPPETA
jgi:hypothetical protein